MFSRQDYDFIDIKEEEVENLQIPTDIKRYIFAVTTENLKFPVFTASFDKVAQQCREHRCVGIVGPKGCGKTFTLVALFVLCYTKLNCLFLTPQTLIFSRYFTCQNYIKTFVTNNKNLDEDDQKTIIDELQKDMVSALELLVDRYKKLESLIVFADISDLTKQNMALLGVLREFSTQARLIVSFSSGATHFTDEQSSARMFLEFYMGLYLVEITSGLTIAQVSTFLSKMDSPVQLQDINHISGTNPFMLSLVRSIPCNNDPIPAKVLTYKANVKFVVSDWLNKNFNLLKPSYSTLAEFFC